MASSSVGLGPQPYEERLRLAQNNARERLSRLQQMLARHGEFSVFVNGEEGATFSVGHCVIDDQAGDSRFLCEGTLRFSGREPQNVQGSLANAVAVSPAVLQKPFWTVQLTEEQQKDLDRATNAVLVRAQTFVPNQRQVREQMNEVVAVDLNVDGRPEVFRMVGSQGQPCNGMSANFLGTWAGSSWKMVRSSISLSECSAAEAAGEDNFSPLFVDIDGDGTAEILMTEGRHESHEWSLYRFVGGSLRRALRIGAYGS